MTANEVVAIIAKQKMVETMIKKITHESDVDTLNDLAQDVYLQLLTQEEKTVMLWEKKELKYFIARVLMNNIASQTSPYYRFYLRYQRAALPLPFEDPDEDEEEY